MADIISIGEILIDFTASVNSENEIFYKQNAGGAPANVAAMAAKLRVSSSFIGKVGNDLFGKYLKEVLVENNVEVRGLVFDKGKSTTLAFVKHSESGERDFVFYRNNTADTNLSFDEVNLKLIDASKIVHFGSLMLTNEPSKTAVIETIKYAHESGKIVTYDPNYRESLWNSKEEAVATMNSVLPYVDIIKVSEDELQAITDSGNMLTSIAKLLESGIKLICITQGAKGSIIATKKGIERVNPYPAETVDTLGAGDSFFGAFLSKIIKSTKTIAQLEMVDLVEFAKYANACGALTATKFGAIPAMPTDEEILELCGKE